MNKRYYRYVLVNLVCLCVCMCVVAVVSAECCTTVIVLCCSLHYERTVYVFMFLPAATNMKFE